MKEKLIKQFVDSIVKPEYRRYMHENEAWIKKEQDYWTEKVQQFIKEYQE